MHTVKEISDDSVTLATECENCHRQKDIDISEMEYKLWMAGALIQNVIPSLDENDRELLISGICGICFDEIMTDEDIEDSDDIAF